MQISGGLLRRVLVFLMGSSLAQATSAITGLLLAHWMSVSDYAVYTVMIMITGAMTLLTKGGVHIGYVALLGRYWPDTEKVEGAGKASLGVRRLISRFVLPPVLLAAAILLVRSGASAWTTAMMLILLVTHWHFDMQTRPIDTVLFFARQTSKVQALDTILSLGRLIAAFLFHLSRMLDSTVAIAINVALTGLRVPPILRWIHQAVPSTRAEPPPADVKFVLDTSMRQLPTELFAVFHTQIVLFVLTFAAPVASVAAYGALTRIPQLLTPIQALSYSFCIPAFTRANENILGRLLLYTGVCAVPAAALVAVAWLAPSALLLLVGERYADLHYELLIAIANAALYNTALIFSNLVTHRGWNRYVWLQILVGVAWCAASPAFLALDTLGGALWLQAGFSLGYVVSAIADLIAAKRRGEYAS